MGGGGGGERKQNILRYFSVRRKFLNNYGSFAFSFLVNIAMIIEKVLNELASSLKKITSLLLLLLLKRGVRSSSAFGFSVLEKMITIVLNSHGSQWDSDRI